MHSVWAALVCPDKVLEVTHHAACAGCGKDTVEEELGGHNISSFSAYVPKVLNGVAAYSPSYAVWVGFFRPVGADNA